MPDALLIGDALPGPGLRHEVPVDIGDPFVHAEVEGRRIAIVWSIDRDRAAPNAPLVHMKPLGSRR